MLNKNKKAKKIIINLSNIDFTKLERRCNMAKEFINENQKSNINGIIGVSTGWLFPIVGLVEGIIALGRKEPNKAFGIISIIESVLFWIFWIAVLLG